MLNQGRLHPRLVVVVPSDCYHWILQPNISRFTWRKWWNFPLESCKGKKKVKMLVMGPICSIRAACCPWSAQKSPFLTSQIDSTVWKTLHMFPGIAYDNLMVFCYRLLWAHLAWVIWSQCAELVYIPIGEKKIFIAAFCHGNFYITV